MKGQLLHIKPPVNKASSYPGRYSLLLILLLTTIIVYAEEKKPLEYEDDEIYMRLVIRNKEQLTGFYTGREFPKPAIDEILKTCFITPMVLNKKFDALWVEPDSWIFMIDGKPIQRITRDYWKAVWQDTGLSLAHQSTFGWTLMPETRDLRFDEGVGGSIVIPMQKKAFTLKARFNTGLDKKGKARVITFKNVLCAN